MKETDFTRKLKRELEHRLPQAVVLKHTDMLTAGIPDLSITHDGRTTWIEVKLASNRRIFEPLQLEILRRLHGWYLVWDEELHKGALFRVDEREAMADPLSRAIIFDQTLSELCDKACRIF